MTQLRALIFDVDGTLADTESVHRLAFNLAFADEGLDWEWDEPLYVRLLDVSGGKERMDEYWCRVRGDGADIDEAERAERLLRLHQRKTQHYERLVSEGKVTWRPGVLALFDEAARAGLTLAIATTTSPANIEALLGSALGPNWRKRFAVVEDAVTAPQKKPHPQVYTQAVKGLGLNAAQCLAFEDSFNGVQAACAAQVPVLVTPNAFTAHHAFTGALRVIADLGGVSVADLRAWHADAGVLVQQA